MKLTQVVNNLPDAEAKVIRDGEFDNLGFIIKQNISKKLVFVESEDYVVRIRGNNEISSVITTEQLALKVEELFNGGILATEKPRLYFYRLHNQLFRESNFYNSRYGNNIIGKDCKISEGAHISEKGVVIGDRVIIEPGAVIFPNVHIGNDCYIGANATIGGRGFQICHSDEGELFYVEHVGGVIIEDGVDIFPNARVVEGLFTPTILHENCKIDAMSQIGHSAEIGKRTIVTSGVLLCGSVVVGEDCWIGAGAIIKELVKIGNHAFICMGAVVAGNVKDNKCVSGNFAIDHKIHMASMLREMKNLEKIL